MNLKKLLMTSVALASLSPGAWAEDVTDTYLKNAGFDDASSFATTNVTGGTSLDVNGWTKSDYGAGYAFGGVFAFGSNYAINSVMLPSINSAGERCSGGALGFSAGWNATVSYTQNVTLPAGKYVLTYSALNRNVTATYAKNLIGFIGGNVTAYAGETSFTYGEWTHGYVSFELTEETAGVVKVGIADDKGTGSGDIAKLFVDYVKLEKCGTAWEQAVFAAKDIIASFPKGASAERAAIKGKIEAVSGEGSEEDISALQALVASFKAIYEVKHAQAIAEAEDVESIKGEYPYTYESLLDVNLSKWSSPDNKKYVAKTGGQHWSGDSSIPYYESDGWSSSSWKYSASESVDLPAGKYAMLVTARSNTGVSSTMSVKVGSSEKTVCLSNEGDTGFGIDVNGIATYASDATYANDGKGRGWKYAYIEFETTEDNPTATISFLSKASSTHQWVSIANPMLYGKVTLADFYKQANLKPAIVSATKAHEAGVNVGTKAFQIPESHRKTLKDAIDKAQSVYDNKQVEADSVKQAAEDLLTAVDTYNKYDNTEINAPEANVPFNIVQASSWTYDGKAVTAYVNASAESGYSLGYKYVPGTTNYEQTIYFKKVEGDVTNGYNLSFIDSDGNKRYVCTAKGGGYNGTNTAGIRTTVDESKALVVKVIPSATEDGIYQLYNTEANNYIGAQDVGFFTVNSHTSFKLLPAAKKSVSRKVVEENYGTIILPYAAEVPAGATVYSVASVNGLEVVLTQESSLKAFTPYIIGAGSYAFSDYAIATMPTYTEGLLTGVLEATNVPTGSYVLQTQEEKGQQFYIVASDTPVTLAANRAYLTVPEATEGALRIGFGGQSTAIDAVEALTNGKAEIYDLNGRKLNGLQKGINIVNGVKVLVK